MNVWEWILSCLGGAVSFGTLLTVTFPSVRKKLKERLFRWENVQKQVDRSCLLLEEMAKEEAKRKEEIALQKEVDLCVLRDLITSMYYRHAAEKKIRTYELEDVFALYDLYCKAGGNSYVHSLYQQMSEEWEISR